MLAFRIEVVIPFEIDIPSLRVLGNDEKQNLNDLKSNLNLNEEVRYDVELILTLNQ